MKLLKLTDYNLTTVKPYVFKDKKGNSYYNIMLGNRDPNGFKYIIKIDKNLHDPDKEQDILLDQDTYFIRPYVQNKKIVNDSKNNPCYILTNDESSVYKNDILLIWEIPNNMYENVKYVVEGNVNTLVCAYTGRTRGLKVYKSPCLLLEIFGDCVLGWSGTTINNQTITQRIEYTKHPYDWKVGLLKT